MRYVRDVAIMACGIACILSQVIIQLQRAEVSIEMLTAGVTLLTSEFFIKLGDRRGNATPIQRSGNHALGWSDFNSRSSGIQKRNLIFSGKHEHKHDNIYTGFSSDFGWFDTDDKDDDGSGYGN